MSHEINWKEIVLGLGGKLLGGAAEAMGLAAGKKLLPPANHDNKDQVIVTEIVNNTSDLSKAFIEAKNDWKALQQEFNQLKEMEILGKALAEKEKLQLEEKKLQIKVELARQERESQIRLSELYRDFQRELQVNRFHQEETLQVNRFHQEETLQAKAIQGDWDEAKLPTILSPQQLKKLIQEPDRLLFVCANLWVTDGSPSYFKTELPDELESKITAFINSNFCQEITFSACFFENKKIFDAHAKQLREIIPNHPVVMNYSKVTDSNVFFHFHLWGSRAAEFLGKNLDIELSWREIAEQFQNQFTDTTIKDIDLYRMIAEWIIILQKMYAMYLIDLYTLMDKDPFYVPKLGRVSIGLPPSLVEQYIQPYIDILQRIQEERIADFDERFNRYQDSYSQQDRSDLSKINIPQQYGQWQCIRTLMAFAERPYSITLNQNGNFLLCLTSDRNLSKLFDIETGKMLWFLSEDAKFVETTLHDDGYINYLNYLLEVKTGQVLKKVIPQKSSAIEGSRINCLSIQNRSSSSKDLELKKVDTGDILSEFSEYGGFKVSSDQLLIAIVSKKFSNKAWTYYFEIWNTQTAELVYQINVNYFSIKHSLSFTSNNQFCVYKIDENDRQNSRINVWNTTEKQPQCSFLIPLSSKTFIDPNEKNLVAVDSKMGLYYHDLNTGKLCYKIPCKSKHSFRFWFFSPDSLFFVLDDVFDVNSDTNKHTPQLWNAQTGQLHFTLECDVSRNYYSCEEFSFSPDSKSILGIFSNRNRIILWKVQMGESRTVLEYDQNIVKSIDTKNFFFSPDSKFVLGIFPKYNSFYLWSVETGKVIFSCVGNHKFTSTDKNKNQYWFSPDNQLLLLDYKNEDDLSCKKILSLNKLEHTYTLSNTQPLSVLSPDWKILVKVTEPEVNGQHNIELCNPVTGKKIQTLQGHYGGVKQIIFSQDNQTIATLGNDLTVKVWRRGSNNEDH